jgi:hypothetical protein
MTRPEREDGSAQASTAPSLQRLWDMAQHAARRPGNYGGPLKVLEMLMGRADFRPKNSGKA